MQFDRHIRPRKSEIMVGFQVKIFRVKDKNHLIERLGVGGPRQKNITRTMGAGEWQGWLKPGVD
jgi:hypothetical protein